MPIWRRLLVYFVGVVLGVFAVMFLFGDRTDIQCTYFPNDRVLYDLRGKELNLTPEIESEMQALQLDTNDINTMLISAKVDFEKSKPKKKGCKTYWLDLKKGTEKPFAAEWKNCDSSATILQIISLK